MLAGKNLDLLTLDDFPGVAEAVEDGATFEENACKKALHYHELTGMATLADDSGLEVDALGGQPGIHSARFAGRQGDDAANNSKLVDMLRGVPTERRTGRFQCVVALACEGEVAAVAKGTVEGLILDEPRGEMGFGYDPLFFLPDLGMTKAQLPLDKKNQLSHRGQAVRNIVPAISKLLEC